MGYRSSEADPDVWMHLGTKPDGEEYFEFMLVYVDGVLSISHDPLTSMAELQRSFKFKNDNIKPPEVYLGARLQGKTINGTKCWTMTSVDYINAAVSNVEEKLKKDD